MRIVSLKEDYVFKEFMSNEVVRKYSLSATLGVPVEQIRSVRMMNTFLRRKWAAQKQGIAQGTGIINVLNQHLIQDNRLEDLRRSTTDSEFQKELIKEYNLK